MGDKFAPNNMVSMLQSRMGWNVSHPECPFREVRCYKLDHERALIFILSSKEGSLLHDELGLFPSDALVTKIRLME